MELLVTGARHLGIELSAEQVARFARYLELLSTWGARINLTSLREPDQIETHHFLDSLAVVAALRGLPARTLLDAGSGAGFPGAVCAFMLPGLSVTLCERRQKKAAFLLTLRREIGAGFKVLTGDVAEMRETFDLVISRAAFPPAEWLAIGAPRVSPSGLLLAMLARDLPLAAPPGFAEALSFPYEIGPEHRLIRGWRRG